MFTRTLYGKLSLSLLGLLCLIGCLLVPLTLRTTQRYQQEVSQSVNRTLAKSLADHLAEKNLLRREPTAIAKAREEIKYLMSINPNIDVYLVDAEGNVQAYSGKTDDVRRRRIDLTPLRRFLSGAEKLPILGDDPRADRGQKVFSVAPFPARVPARPGQEPGFVYVVLGGDRYDTLSGLLSRSYILRTGIGALALVLALVSVAGFLLFRLLTRRLRNLTATIEAFQSQGMPEANALGALPVGGDEIDRLDAVYRQMSDRIRRQIEELAQADTHRREMVSNVSHDLRTPLAALQGYLETLLMKEGRLTPDEQREYIRIAMRHGERLAKLVDELFELAQLDAREVPVNLEPFSLGELAQDIVQQHRLRAEENGIRLQAQTPDDLPFVHADIALIERVLENLIENALRYTPSGGAVTVRLARGGDAITVVVADTGSGIAPEEVPHIFERFYRAPNQSEQGQPLEKPSGAGLGLAIAKRILEIHGSPIAVESLPGEGTSFRFHLLIAI